MQTKKMKEMKHSCGCQTEKKEGIWGKPIIIITPCKRHEDGTYIWKAFQHKE